MSITAQGQPETKPFDKYEKRGAYHWTWYVTNKNSYRENVDFVISHLPDQGSVLDIGGGDGLISFKLFEKGFRVTCLDSSRVGIALARACFERAIYGQRKWTRVARKVLSRLRISRTTWMHRYEAGEASFLAKSVFDMPDDARYDYVVCHEVIEHVPQPEKLLQSIHQLMRQYAIISTPDTTGRPQHPLDYFSWTPQTFSDLLKPYRYEFIRQDGWSMYVKLHK